MKDRNTYRNSHQYVWPIYGLSAATPAQRALFRSPSSVA
jgi:hypothetical protein